MKLHTRKEFLKLPKNTIYSKADEYDLLNGLFCKTSYKEFLNDWVEQDLLSETGCPNNIDDTSDAFFYQMALRDNFKEFRTDLHFAGRDGMFDEDDVFVVWDNTDIKKLVDYLNNCINDK